MTTWHHDVGVLGLGLIGAAATRYLAEAGADVVGIGPPEPADFAAHEGPFASHYDSGRITRRLDPSPHWATLASRSIAQYPAIERASGISFHSPSGAVFAELDQERIAAIVGVGRDQAIPHVTGGPAPAALHFAAGATTIAEPAPAGFVDPRRMLAAQLKLAEQAGARLQRVAATRIESRADGFAIHRTGADPAGEASIMVRTLVVAAGAYTGWLLGRADNADDLVQPVTRQERREDHTADLLVRPETVVLARLDDPAEIERLAGLPAVLAVVNDDVFGDLYLVPPTIYPDGHTWLKLGATRRHITYLAEPGDAHRWMSGSAHEADLPRLRALLEELVPGLTAAAWLTKPCLIEDTPSGRPIIELVRDGLVVAAGGNGYAAKSADAIGHLAARLAMDGRWTDPELRPEDFRRGPVRGAAADPAPGHPTR